MKEISFNKKNINENGSKFEFKYIGNHLDDYDISNKIDEKLNAFINDIIHNDMLRNVSFLRTILKDYNEKLLVVSYQDKTKSELVKYDNTNIFLFESRKNKNKIKYEPNIGIKFNFIKNEIDVMDYQGRKLIKEEVADVIDYIFKLKNIKPLELNRETKYLIEIYKLFYNEIPNFVDKNINIKIQSMLLILLELGVSLPYDYGFSLYSLQDMPLSLELQNLVNGLYPFGKISNIDNSIGLDKYVQKEIKIIGENIRKAINEKNNKEEALKTISRIIYVENYNLSSKKDMAVTSNCSKDEVETNIQLVKKINKKLDQLKR